MTIIGLILVLGGVVFAIVVGAAWLDQKRHPDPKGSFWRHIFKE